MPGYLWDPVFRVVPQNGAETVYWLSDRLSDLGCATRIGLRYPETMNVREDLNRSLRPVVFGIRPEVTFQIQIFSMADQLFLAEIESALLQPRDCDVFLSLDGGVIYRQVVLASGADPQPIAGKTCVGAAFDLAVRCVDLIPTKPAMMTDPGVGAELVGNGDFEQWVTGASAQGWSSTATVLTQTQEATPHAGSYSAKLTRDSSGSFGQFGHQFAVPPKPGAWYRANAWHRGSIAMALSASGAFRLQIFNSTQDSAVKSDGKTWGTSSESLILAATTTSFAQETAYFRMPSTVLASDAILVRLSGYFTNGESMYYDDVSVYGPVLRPGYATW